MPGLARTRSLLVAACALTLAIPACKREEKARRGATVEETPELASVVHVADPKAAFQLVRGFYGLEQNSWRWTMRQFSVVLRPPAGAAKNGATLQLKLSVPEPIIKRLGPVTLSASAGGAALQPEPLAEAGEYTYTRDVPASVLGGDSVTVDFALDKALSPGDVDKRELGIIVITVGLEPK